MNRNGFLELLCVTLWFDNLVQIIIGCKLILNFLLRFISKKNSRAVQCNLPINLFNELIFIIIWAWFIFLTSLTCVSLILCFISIYTNIGHRFIRKYLYISIPKLDKKEEDEFIEKYLRWDGILVLRLLSQNINDVLMSDLVAALYQIHSNLNKDQYSSDDRIQSSGLYMRIDSSPM